MWGIVIRSLDNPLINIASDCPWQVRIRGDIPIETLEYFYISKPKLERFYLLPKIPKRLNNVEGRHVISNVDFFGKHCSFSKPAYQNVKSIIKDNKYCLKKLNKLRDFYAIDVVGLYSNIPVIEGPEGKRQSLDKQKDQTTSTSSLSLFWKTMLSKIMRDNLLN